MKRRIAFAVGWLALPLTQAAVSQPVGLTNRVANITLRLPPSPPVFGYATTNAFGDLTFTNPVAITAPPGDTNRLFVVEQGGRVVVITNLAAPTRTVFLDLSGRVAGGTPTDERGLLGLAFHPGYATNRRFYVYFSLNTTTPAGAGLHQRLSRFEASPSNPDAASSDSEQVLLTMRDEAANHNGGDLHFGPDGYLYVSLGDEGQQNDSLNNSQRIDKDFWATLLRLDVDRRPGNLTPNPHPAIAETNYLVPVDNPFVGAPSFNGASVDPAAVRTEIYATGFRNPWRFSFDPATGLLYCADVGQGAWEEIDLVLKGGNYGWAFREGRHPGPKIPPAEFSSIDPIHEYSHGNGTNQGYSVTGGVVYRGTRIPDLWGRYVFADYVTDHLWSFRYDGTNVTEFRRLTSNPDVAGIGVDPSNGDVLLADQSADTIKRLIHVPVSGSPFPPTLAETGVFSNLATLAVNPGIVPYEVNVPFWSDHAQKRRWFSVPNPALQITFRATNNWTFPTGTVWIKHFELELTNGVPESRRRLETRLLVRDSASGVYGITYRWGDSISNALLVPDGGLDETFVVHDGGRQRTQVWHYPGRSECLQCHTPLTQGGLALGFNTPQLNRDFDDGGMPRNQIRALADAGYFTAPPPTLSTLRRLPALTNEAWSLESRVRAYFAVNCSQCHQPGGAGRGNFDARPFKSLTGAALVDNPLFNDFGDSANRVIAPDSIEHSMALTRLATLGPGRMPPVGSSVIDTQAVALLSRWITNDLPARASFTNWQVAYFSSVQASEAAAGADPDSDRAPNFLEWLVGTSPTNAAEFWGATLERSGDRVDLAFPRVAGRGFEVQWTANLFATNSWQALDVSENRPFFSASNELARVPDMMTNASGRFYRVRAYEP